MSALHPDGLSLRRNFAFRWSILTLRPDLILTQSQEMGKMFTGFGYKTGFLANGVDVQKFQPYSPRSKRQLRRKYGIDHDLFQPSQKRLYDFPYVLHVGSEHPMKNLEVAFSAFYRIKQRPSFKDLKLLRVGGTQPRWRQRVRKQIERLGLEGEVIFAGYVPRSDLPHIYSQAELLIFPSLYEGGFALPIIEAMACGTPVLASSVSEEVGEAGIAIDPPNVDSFAESMYQVLTDSSLRGDLVNRGLAWAKRFNWRRTAEETLRVYREVGS